MTGDFLSQKQCQTCMAHFSTHDELRSHIEAYKSAERRLALATDKCRMHAAQIYDSSNICDNCQVNSILTAPSNTVDNGSDTEANDGQEDTAAPDGSSNSTPRSRHYSCPYKGCSQKSKNRKQLIAHFGTHIDCDEVCVQCFQRLHKASTLIRHAKNHSYSNNQREKYMLALRDEFRARVFSEFERMVGKMEQPSNITNSKAAKRKIDLTGVDQDNQAVGKATKIVPASDQATDGLPQDNLLSSNYTDIQPESDLMDRFAPPLFFDYLQQQPTLNFDPPFFEASSPHYGAHLHGEHIGGFGHDIDNSFLSSGP